MAKSQTKHGSTAKKADAGAIDKSVTASAEKVGEAVEVDSHQPVKVDAVAEAVAAPSGLDASGATDKKSTGPKAPAKKKPSSRKSTLKKAASRQVAAPSNTPIAKLKETIMATANTEKTTEYTAVTNDMAEEMQSRAKAAYDKGTEMTKEAVEFQKGNFEAMVESSKILASGMQDMGRTYVEEAKSVADAMQGDVKNLASAKSPTDLFQLQGEIARRNFDAMVSTASKNTEAMLKLLNEAFAPLSSRMSLAAEKVRTTA
ncbi:MAG: hypothetical protein CL949_11875 [Erythrobacter sp.]|nr:hypothetical protein [Erythrobacter sp.]